MRIQPSNETREAYTGNYTVRKGIRISLKQFSFVSACEISAVGDRLNIAGSQYKETVRIEIKSEVVAKVQAGKVLEGLSESKSVECIERNTRNLGDPLFSSFFFKR